MHSRVNRKSENVAELAKNLSDVSKCSPLKRLEIVRIFGFVFKGEHKIVVSIYWSKVLNKPFILMQDFLKSV